MGRLKPRSAKRRAEANQRAAIVIEALRRAGHQCQARHLVPEVRCGGPLDPDEIMGRGVLPGAHLIQDNVQILCRAHHDWKHDHPTRARDLGLTKRYGDA